MQDIVNITCEDSLLDKGLKEGLVIIGGGNQTRFWADPWVGNVTLRNKFPRLFAMRSDKSSMVGEVGVFAQGKWVWDLSFRRTLFEWELEIHNTFMNVINSFFPSANSSDRICWIFYISGAFSVKGLCKWVEERVFNEKCGISQHRLGKLSLLRLDCYIGRHATIR